MFAFVNEQSHREDIVAAVSLRVVPAGAGKRVLPLNLNCFKLFHASVCGRAILDGSRPCACGKR